MSPRKPVTFEIKTRRGLVAIVIVAAIMLPVATYLSGSKVAENESDVAENCAKIHKIIGVGDEIIASGRTSTEQYYRDGLLTKAQRDRALVQIDQQLARWRSADCQ